MVPYWIHTQDFRTSLVVYCGVTAIICFLKLIQKRTLVCYCPAWRVVSTFAYFLIILYGISKWYRFCLCIIQCLFSQPTFEISSGFQFLRDINRLFIICDSRTKKAPARRWMLCARIISWRQLSALAGGLIPAGSHIWATLRGSLFNHSWSFSKISHFTNNCRFVIRTWIC